MQNGTPHNKYITFNGFIENNFAGMFSTKTKNAISKNVRTHRSAYFSFMTWHSREAWWSLKKPGNRQNETCMYFQHFRYTLLPYSYFTDIPEGLVVHQLHEIRWDQYGPEIHDEHQFKHYSGHQNTPKTKAYMHKGMLQCISHEYRTFLPNNNQ